MDTIRQHVYQTDSGPPFTKWTDILLKISSRSREIRTYICIFQIVLNFHRYIGSNALWITALITNVWGNLLYEIIVIVSHDEKRTIHLLYFYT